LLVLNDIRINIDPVWRVDRPSWKEARGSYNRVRGRSPMITSRERQDWSGEILMGLKGLRNLKSHKNAIFPGFILGYICFQE
jgi:hypothetical protein